MRDMSMGAADPERDKANRKTKHTESGRTANNYRFITSPNSQLRRIFSFQKTFDGLQWSRNDGYEMQLYSARSNNKKQNSETNVGDGGDGGSPSESDPSSPLTTAATRWSSLLLLANYWLVVQALRKNNTRRIKINEHVGSEAGRQHNLKETPQWQHWGAPWFTQAVEDSEWLVFGALLVWECEQEEDGVDEEENMVVELVRKRE
ncbi:hypothetical protein C8Q75DRAFT_737111 [Abortiporus biennis]|nr:hypothetical protein C8Q75DRAFT_737111 [Abortiporus biennis]